MASLGTGSVSELPIAGNVEINSPDAVLLSVFAQGQVGSIASYASGTYAVVDSVSAQAQVGNFSFQIGVGEPVPGVQAQAQVGSIQVTEQYPASAGLVGVQAQAQYGMMEAYAERSAVDTQLQGVEARLQLGTISITTTSWIQDALPADSWQADSPLCGDS